jgi:hypothetical protein
MCACARMSHDKIHVSSISFNTPGQYRHRIVRRRAHAVPVPPASHAQWTHDDEYPSIRTRIESAVERAM